jgi:hypothetical protein
MQARNPWRFGAASYSRHACVFWTFLAIALAFLALEHRAHLLGLLPFLLLLACPLMHLFMHHGHSGHGPGHDEAARKE